MTVDIVGLPSLLIFACLQHTASLLLIADYCLFDAVYYCCCCSVAIAAMFAIIAAVAVWQLLLLQLQLLLLLLFARVAIAAG